MNNKALFLNYKICLLLSFLHIFGNNLDDFGANISGYHLDSVQYQSEYVGSWVYIGLALEQMNERHKVSGYRISKDMPIHAFARFGLRAHTSLSFALDVCGQVVLNQENTHSIVSNLNYLYFFQTSYNPIPSYYLGVGGPVEIKSLFKMFYRINLKDLCLSNFIFGKRLGAKKFIQLQIQDFRHLGFSKDNFYMPTLEKLAEHTMFEIGVGF